MHFGAIDLEGPGKDLFLTRCAVKKREDFQAGQQKSFRPELQGQTTTPISRDL